MAEPLTLMAVHAHPDDEVIGTGGVLARYAREGVRTVVVTCTNGELGDTPDGKKPGEDGHDPALVAAHRLGELRRSIDALGVAHLELLGYPDSGMMGWQQNDAVTSFWQTPVEEAASRLAELVERYRPQVVVTYDENGFYGHPDHIQANRIAVAATNLTGIPQKLYFTAVAFSSVKEMAARMGELGMAREGFDFDPDNPPFGVPDDQISATIDVTSVAEHKRAALHAHASQPDNAFFLQLPDEILMEILSRESFVRHIDRTGAALPEDDLFAGLR